MGGQGLHLCLWRGGRRPVRFLYPRYGHVHQGASGQKPRPDGGRDQICPAQQLLPLHRLCEDHRCREAGGSNPAGGPDSRGIRHRLEGRLPGSPAGRGGKGAGLRQISRRLLPGAYHLRRGAAKQISPRPGVGHRHLQGQSTARRGGRADRRRHSRPEQNRPPEARPVHPDSRGRFDPLSGRRHRPGDSGGYGHRGEGQKTD